MLKWCPKYLSVDRAPATSGASPRTAFESGLASGTTVSVPGDGPVFENDPGLTGNTSLWDLMSDREKEDLITSVDGDIRKDFEDRENEFLEKHGLELARVREELETRLENWSLRFSEDLDRERHDLAAEAAGLAVTLARKIIRDAVAVDQDVVVRTLETALYKARDSHPLTAILHPEDAAYLAANPTLMERLRIDKVVPDRRVEKGGCCLKSGSKEWDATLTRQIDTLAALVEETVANAENEKVPGNGENDDPGLE